ncbi:DUF4917 family protein [Massilia sp. LC238]|uniref:DUF4917 family protein n=1 Tax=Massilia sp. LC238 TaxID=1502852 RepID=UPI0004E32CDA|nr:DUF4917 family protein [Massilia sp. LC238]KFC65651.1 hypothetical protein FG94_03736 [Massilia sp. LC238]
MTKINQWEEIKERFKDGLLLGNGASMAIHRGFGYAGLFEAAQEHQFITPEVASVFDAFGVNDFELVLRRLWQAKVVNQTLGIAAGRVEEAYAQVRTALIETVRHVHINHDDAVVHLKPIYTFMQGFKTVVSLNYDLIVYWAAMYSRDSIGSWFKDCFVGGTFADNWEPMREPYGAAAGATLFFYPHGNLALARALDDEEGKLTARGQDLLTRILKVWESGQAVPLFVCEGTSEYKVKSIRSSSYLQRVNREVLPNIGSSLVIYGWGLAEQEQHILAALSKSNCKRVAVSVYANNEEYMRRAEQTLRDIGIEEVVFFDSTSPGCWNNLTP